MADANRQAGDHASKVTDTPTTARLRLCNSQGSQLAYVLMAITGATKLISYHIGHCNRSEDQIDGLVQDCTISSLSAMEILHISSLLAMEILQVCTKPSK